MISLNENFVYRKVYNVYFLVPVKRNNVSNDTIFLNETAALIFKLCEQVEDVHALAVQVFSNFIDANVDEVIPELESYIQELIYEGLLVER